MKDTSKDSEDKNIARFLKSGMVSWSGKKPSGGRVRPAIEGKTVSEMIIEERGQRGSYSQILCHKANKKSA